VTGVLVGIDESEGAVRALAWAVEEAALRRTSLTALHVCWSPDSDGIQAAIVSESVVERLREELAAVEQEAQTTMQALVDRVTAQRPGAQPVDVRVLVRAGRPAAELLRAAGEADLVVVGDRGRGGFAHLLLGSVSHQLVHHAPCPVVVVRPPAAGAAAP
jgi:nucleotide-binding universal stress UspA family protein